jgi:hypothetical protein
MQVTLEVHRIGFVVAALLREHLQQQGDIEEHDVLPKT